MTSSNEKMKTFSSSLTLCAGNSPVNFPLKGQWRGALMLSLICDWTNGWVNNRNAGELGRHRAHYDATVMMCHWLRLLWLWCSTMMQNANTCTHSTRKRFIYSYVYYHYPPVVTLRRLSAKLWNPSWLTLRYRITVNKDAWNFCSGSI